MNATVSFEKNTRDFGLMFRTSDDFEKSYYIRLVPEKNKVVFDMWPRDRAEVSEMVELERPLKLTPGTPIALQLFVEGNKGVAYVNNTAAMNFRAYDITEGNWGVFVTDGSADFRDTSIMTI